MLSNKKSIEKKYGATPQKKMLKFLLPRGEELVNEIE